MPHQQSLIMRERFLRAHFDSVASFTIGAEEELLLVDPRTTQPLPAAELALSLFEDDPRVAAEFRETQVEIKTPVCVAAADVVRELTSLRRSLATALRPEVLLLAVGVHPTATAPGPVSSRARHASIAAAQPWAARHLLTCGMHVHVAVGGSDRALAVHNALRSFLPEIAALSANAPFHTGHDTRLASARPLLNRSLSRAGAPPAFPTWSAFAEFLAWADRSSRVPGVDHLWWDLRLRPETGTIEVRAADVQTRVEDAAGIIALIQCLVYDLASRYDAGTRLAVHDRDRIAEAMLVATRDGLDGLLPDLDTGEPELASGRLESLIDRLEPTAGVLGCAAELEQVMRTVAEGGGARRQRTLAASRGLDGLVRHLVHETSLGASDRIALRPRPALLAV